VLTIDTFKFAGRTQNLAQLIKMFEKELLVLLWTPNRIYAFFLTF